VWFDRGMADGPAAAEGQQLCASRHALGWARHHARGGQHAAAEMLVGAGGERRARVPLRRDPPALYRRATPSVSAKLHPPFSVLQGRGFARHTLAVRLRFRRSEPLEYLGEYELGHHQTSVSSLLGCPSIETVDRLFTPERCGGRQTADLELCHSFWEWFVCLARGVVVYAAFSRSVCSHARRRVPGTRRCGQMQCTRKKSSMAR
jgi:hypothetical protein